MYNFLPLNNNATTEEKRRSLGVGHHQFRRGKKTAIFLHRNAATKS